MNESNAAKNLNELEPVKGAGTRSSRRPLSANSIPLSTRSASALVGAQDSNRAQLATQETDL